MHPQLEEIREQQKQSWNTFSGGWKKWDGLTMEFMKPVGDAIIAAIEPAGSQVIVDIASGTGEPALTIAGMLAGGKVIMTDIADDMLAIAKENAVARNIANVETVLCDVCELPFDSGGFDALSCRFGFMFFPDMELAASEMLRVLKPGGKMATSVWNIPEKNFWVTAVMGTINKNMELPQNASGAPGMFRCCKPGMMEALLENAGFKNIAVQEIPLKLNAGTLANFWGMMTEVGAPIVAALSQANDAMRQKIKEEVFELVNQKYPDGNIAIDANAIVISAEK